MTTLEVPRMDSDCYSSDNSPQFSSSREDCKWEICSQYMNCLIVDITSNELLTLRNKIDSVKITFWLILYKVLKRSRKNLCMIDRESCQEYTSP